MVIDSSEVRKALAALRYHDRLSLEQVPGYKGSSFEADTLEGIEALKELFERMTNSDLYDFLGGEI